MHSIILVWLVVSVSVSVKLDADATARAVCGAELHVALPRPHPHPAGGRRRWVRAAATHHLSRSAGEAPAHRADTPEARDHIQASIALKIPRARSIQKSNRPGVFSLHSPAYQITFERLLSN